MRSCRLFTFLVAVLAVSAGAGASPVPDGFAEIALRDLLVRQWTVADGLPTESLTDVLQTRDGFLWIASYEGLFRFDGLRFEVFDKQRISARKAPGEAGELAADGFYQLAEDPSGALWAAGQGGQAVRYQNGSFRIFETSIEGPVNAVCIDGSDRLWLGGRSPVQVDLARQTLTPDAIPELSDTSIQALVCGPRTVWLGSARGGLFELRDGAPPTPAVAAGEAIEALALSHDGSLWIGSRAGLRRWAGGETESFAQFRGVGIYRILEDRQGDLWLATTRGLGRRRASGAVEWLDAADSGLREAQALRFDREGSLWVAGRRGGLFRLEERKLASLSARDGLREGSVDAILESSSGDILIGFDDYLAAVGGDMRPTARALPAELGGFDVLTLLEDRGGDLWIGSYLGLLRVDGEGRDGGFEWFSQETGFPSSQIRALHQDRAGSIWIGTADRGVLKMGPKGLPEILDQTSGWVSDYVFSIDEDLDGDLLFGMRGGFHILARDGGLSTYRSGRDFPGSIVFSIFADADGRLWLSTDGGLVRFDGERFGTVDQSHGLPTEVIFDLREDDSGWIWISSSKGLIRSSKDALNGFLDGRAAAVGFDLFDEQDGMSSRQCTAARRMLKASDGRLWVPTHDGVTIVDPRRLLFNEHPPPVVVDRFQVDGEEVAADAVTVLPPGSSRFELEFAILSFRDPAKNRARYVLEGFDRGWREAGNQRSVTYTSLPHGRYVFRVTGSNDDGLWNDSGARLAFEVSPFYYETRAFGVTVVAVFVLAVAAVYRWRHRAIRRRNSELVDLGKLKDRLLAEREQLITDLRISNDELESFTYAVSHDLKSPLITILGYLGFLEQDARAGKTERVAADAGRIRAAAEKMRRLLEDLLELSRIGRNTDPPRAVAMDELAAEAVEQLAGTIAETGVEVVVAPDLPIVTGDRVRLLQVFQNLLENAVKYRGRQPAPRVEVGFDGIAGSGVPAFYVRDNGRGIDPRFHDKIFGLFERLDADDEGSGVGLALVKRVVEAHGGRVWVESEGRDQGATFFFTLPRSADAAGLGGEL